MQRTDLGSSSRNEQMPSGMGEKENSAKAEGLLLRQWEEKLWNDGEWIYRMHEQHIFMYKEKMTEVFILEVEMVKHIGFEAHENLRGWRRTREDLLGGAGVGETAASCVDFEGVDEVELVEGEVGSTGIGFKNLRLRQ